MYRYGLHKLTFKKTALWVHYRPLLSQVNTNADFREQITIFADLTVAPVAPASPEMYHINNNMHNMNNNFIK